MKDHVMRGLSRFTVLIYGALSLLVVKTPATAASNYQCEAGPNVAIVAACGARWEAANVRAHVAAGQYGGASAACLNKTASLLDDLAQNTLSQHRALTINAGAWPCGKEPAGAKADDGVLATACPNAVWGYEDRGLPGCKASAAQHVMAAAVPSTLTFSGNGASGGANFGGSPYCDYYATITINDFTLIVGQGDPLARLHATMRETSPACAFAPLGTREETYTLTGSKLSDTQVHLQFQGNPDNVPPNDARFEGTLSGRTLSGTWTFSRNDLGSVPQVQWTINLRQTVTAN